MKLVLALLLAMAGPAFAADARWDQYQLIMWQKHPAAALGGLAALGFTGAKVTAVGGELDLAERDAPLAAGLGIYLENVATDFYAPYHRYTVGKPVTWLFDAARARRRAAPEDPIVFHRDPSLSDPAWLARVAERVERLARAEAPRRPLFLNLGDESGIADLAAAWDFDRGPLALAAFRAWLQTEYGSVAALNRQWGTAFAAWDAVEPETTDTALTRTDDNFSSWNDHKAWMDMTFAQAVRAGTDAAHRGDPAALAALEGAQVPGWGGYDYTRLAPAVDVLEIYDIGQSLDLAMAANPALIALRTSFNAGPREVHALWRNVLHGGRGTIVWDETDQVVAPDGTPRPRGRELQAFVQAVAPVFEAVRSPAPDAVAVLVNQASFRARWLLDRQAGDRDWAARDAEREYDDTAWRASRRVLLERLAALGTMPRLIGEARAEALDGTRVLFLPHAIALSDAEVEAIRAFEARGGTVLADTEPGLFDGHLKRRAALPFPNVKRPEAVRPVGEAYEPGRQQALAALLQEAGAPPRVAVHGPDGLLATGVEARWFANGSVLSLQAAQPFGGPAEVNLRFDPPRMVRDLSGAGPDGLVEWAKVQIGPVAPVLLRVGEGTAPGGAGSSR